MIENHADVGIGIDGDGDRVGIIDENGKMIFADYYAIIVWRYLMDKVQNKKALFDVKCTKSLADEVTKLGGEPVCYRTGNSYQKKYITFNLNEINEFIKLCNNGILINPTSNMVEKPKITALIPVYNSNKYIKAAIRSIQNQNMPEIEIMIVDDFSTDNTLNILKLL